MKRYLALILCALMMLGLLSGCAGQTDGEKTLTVATSPDFAPMSFVSSDTTKTGNDRFVGFDMLLAKYLAEEMGMELQIQAMSFDACQTAVSMGSVDLALAGFSWKADRETNYNLSNIYNAGDDDGNQVLITLAENAGKYDTLEQLTGIRVGAQTASLQETLATEQLTGCEIVTVLDLTTALMQLRNGDFEVMAVEGGNAEAIVNNNPDVIIPEFRFEVDDKYVGYVALMQKGNDELTEKVNILLAKAEEEGLLTAWYEEAKSTAGIEVSYDGTEQDEVSGGLGTTLSNIGMLWGEYWQVFLFEGLGNTLLLTLIAVVLGVLLGIVVALLKMSKYRICRFFISVYIEVIRGTPILLQLYIFYFVLPKLLPFLNLSSFMWVAIALCVNSSAYVSEVIRSGIQAVDKGQTEAARSLGLSASQTMVKIVMPQAVRNILPALGNEFIMILKETSLASTFFLGDLMTKYLEVKGATYLGFEALLIVGMIYLCLTFPLSKLVAAFEKKMTNDKSYKAKKSTKKEKEAKV